MKITTVSVLTVAFSLFAADAFAQANHNTTRSNKTVPIASDTQTETDKEKKAADKLGDIEGETQRTASGYIKIGDIKGETTRAAAPTGCVMLSGGMDNDCDGIEDGKAPGATDYNSSRSNKADSVTDTKPEGDTKATDYNSSRSNKNSSN
jgi:hypothetical protein